MSIHSRMAVCVVALVLAPVALGQQAGSTSTESTAVSSQVKSGVVESVAGNKVVLREADGLHEYNLPDGFKFQLAGKDVGVADLQPGMTVNALVTDKVTTRQVTLTRIASGTVAQIAPGGIVVKEQNGDLKSYNFKDASGNDIYFVRDGKEVSLRNVKQGERLSGTFVSTLPAQQTSQRTVVAKATEPAPPPAPEPVAVAAATPRRLPKTASPLPMLGVLALVAGGIALSLRAVRALR
jgi:hypothetical protein